MEYWIVGLLSILGITAAIIQFWRTPVHLRYRIFSRAASIEEKVKSYPASAGAVIIKVQKKRALAHSVALLLPLAIMVLVEKTHISGVDRACSELFGLNKAFLRILMVSYGIPLVMMNLAFYTAWLGVKGFLGGYFPPLDSAWMHDRVAVRGWRATLRSSVCVLLVFLGVAGLYNGHTLYQSVSGGKAMNTVVAELEAKCR